VSGTYVQAGHAAQGLRLRQARGAIEKLLGLKAPDVRARWREALTPEAHRPSGSHNNVMTSVQGNSLGYTPARLKRAHAEFYGRVIAGELSANVAAIEAGFRMRPSALEQILKLVPKLTVEERRQLREPLDHDRPGLEVI
jgi:hypothetical protein